MHGPGVGEDDRRTVIRRLRPRAVSLHRITPFESRDPDTKRIWWTDGGVHQNLTFPVQPDPISGMHCWHQRVAVRPAAPDDQYGDVQVDTKKSMEVYRQWLEMTRPAPGPDGLRRPPWFARVLKPAPRTYHVS